VFRDAWLRVLQQPWRAPLANLRPPRRAMQPGLVRGHKRGVAPRKVWQQVAARVDERRCPSRSCQGSPGARALRRHTWLCAQLRIIACTAFSLEAITRRLQVFREIRAKLAPAVVRYVRVRPQGTLRTGLLLSKVIVNQLTAAQRTAARATSQLLRRRGRKSCSYCSAAQHCQAC
jgi:hypothetical protein